MRAVVVLAFGLSTGTARAQHHELQRSDATTLGIELGASLITATATLLVPHPETCRWCSPPGFDRSMASLFTVQARKPAAHLSHVLSMSILPSASLALLMSPALTGTTPERVAFEDVSIALQAMAWNIALSQAVKKIVARRRPAYFYERSASTEYPDLGPQRNQSFFSGDTSSAFVLASSVTTLAYLRGYSWAPYAAIGGGALATATGLLRLAADVHWSSDVLVGAVAGSAIGCLVPVLLHPRVSGAPAQRATSSLFTPEVSGSMTGVSWSASF